MKFFRKNLVPVFFRKTKHAHVIREIASIVC